MARRLTHGAVRVVDLPMPVFYDISLPITEGLPVWPGDTPVTVARGDSLPMVTTFTLSSHAGTHVDAPAHFIRGGTPVDRLPLDVLIGPAWVAHLPGPGPLTADRLRSVGIPEEGLCRLLLRTDNSDRRAGQTGFDPDFVALAPDAAEALLARGVRLVGIDGPSIESYGASSGGAPAHHALLEAGVVLVENLALAGIAAGAYRLICLPLRLAGGDGAPARVILIREW